jgi:DNA-binding NtrC family response regulator
MRHVLVVDDRPDICAVVQMALEESGIYRVSAATEIAQALSLLDRDKPDLLILDAVMPGSLGFCLANGAVERAVPMIMMTGEPVMNELLDELGWSHLRKPFRLPQLLAETRRTLDESQENLRMVRASLQTIAGTTGDLRKTLEQLRALRRRTADTVARAKRLPPLPGPGA